MSTNPKSLETAAKFVIQARNERNRLRSRNPLRRLLLEVKGLGGALSTAEKVHLDKFAYPHYAYGIYVACLQARMLSTPRITVLEFGVAGGNGLVAMETASEEIGGWAGVEVDVIGIDQGGAGLPNSSDYRDMVYWFKPGAYAMDEAKLRARLSRASLVLGDINKTLPELISRIQAPVGFCSLDMDYHSSTCTALRLFESPTTCWLPRVMLYADDIFGFDDLNIMGRDVGEELAFADFNARHPKKKISVVRGLAHKRPRPAVWNEKMFALHDFEHPRHNECINPLADAEMAGLLSLR